MGRSSKEQANANHQRIVDVAGKLFRERGYEAVGIVDVMTAAGMTQGGFYKHFSSKKALAAEAWMLGFQKAEIAWREQRDRETSLASLVDFYLSPKKRQYRCPLVAHGEDAARMDEGSELRQVYTAGAKALYEAFVSKEPEAGEARQSKLLFAAMIGANLLGGFDPDRDEEWLQEIRFAVAHAAKDSRASASRRRSRAPSAPRALCRQKGK